MDARTLPPRPSHFLIASLALLLLVQGPRDTTAGPPPIRNHVFFETSVAVGTRFTNDLSGVTLGLHLTSAPPNGVGIDFSVLTFLDPLIHGSVNGVTDLDAVYLAWGPSEPQVVLRAGVTTFLAHGMALGLNGGAGVILPIGRNASLRVDYTYRRFVGDVGVGLSRLSLGAGIDY